MRLPVTSVLALAVCLLGSPRLAPAEPAAKLPLPIGFHANAQYDVGSGRPLVLAFTRPGKPIEGLHCRIAQGDDGDDDQPVDDITKPKPACVFRSFAGPTSPFKPGPAKLRISAYIHGTWVEGPTFPIVIAQASVVPKGGAGTKFDARFWQNTGGGEGQMHIEDARIKNGTLTFALMIGNFSFGGVHAIVEKDGVILPQTIALPAGKPKPGEKIYDEEREEADATKSIVVSGNIEDSVEGRLIWVTIQGAKIGDSQRRLEAKLVRHGDKGTQNSACYVKWDTRSHCPGED